MSTLEDCNSKIMSLLYIFKEETKMLRSGQLSQLPAILDAKINGIADLEKSLKSLHKIQIPHTIRMNLSAIEKASKKNGRLLQSTLSGIRSAQERLDNLKYKTKKINTYNHKGQTQALDDNYSRKNKLV